MAEKAEYKLAVMSDSHGKVRNIESVLGTVNECDWFVYLGDGNRDIDKIADKITVPVVRVRGNCDGFIDLPAETVLRVGKSDFLITHGNMYGVKSSLLSLASHARELGCAYALYGHTHVALQRISEGVTLINPGTMSGHTPTFAIVEGDGVLFSSRIIEVL